MMFEHRLVIAVSKFSYKEIYCMVKRFVVHVFGHVTAWLTKVHVHIQRCDCKTVLSAIEYKSRYNPSLLGLY